MGFAWSLTVSISQVLIIRSVIWETLLALSALSAEFRFLQLYDRCIEFSSFLTALKLREIFAANCDSNGMGHGSAFKGDGER